MGPLGVGSGVDPDEGRMYSLVGNPMGISGIWGFSLKRLPSAEQRKGFVETLTLTNTAAVQGVGRDLATEQQ